MPYNRGTFVNPYRQDVPPFVDILFATFAFLFGLVFGSFLNVCIYRLPRGLSVVTPRSACPNCHKPIAAYDNIPVLSWIILGGKCRNCKTPITPRYAIVELVCGLLVLACYLEYGPKLGPSMMIDGTVFKVLLLPYLLRFLKYAILAYLLLGLIFTDAETQLLPDKMTLPGLVIGLIFSVLVPMQDLVVMLFLEFVPFPIPHGHQVLWISVISSVTGAIVGGGFIWGVGALWKLARGYEGMGFGDVKLMAMVGAYLGAATTLIVIFTASIMGSVIGLATIGIVYLQRRGRYVKKLGPAQGASRARKAAFVAYRYLPMPFGVSLGAMALVAVYFSRYIYHWWLGTP
ncbi:prepilin peptidase [Candidatus Korobacter versatilis]|uniref:prepilin peptidase n=1 Tax=Candidatus Korobacter versatilis TaxID=658062 RepID=UPI001650C51A|nr:A24 family peptidase [Candidatus Koribacter versatilis]